MEKIKTYLGFAIKSGKIVYGEHCLKKERKIFLVLVCNTAGKNALKIASSVAFQKGVKAVQLKGALSELTARPTCKMCGIKDENLAKAILLQKGEYLEINRGEENL